MTENGFTRNLKKLAALALFTASSFAATAQINQATKPKEKLHALRNTEFVIPVLSYHTNRLIPFREVNPGLLIKQNVNDHMSFIGGAYANSNYRITETLGTMIESDPLYFRSDKKGVSIRPGITIGIAMYHKNREADKNTVIMHNMPANGELPKNVKKRGESIMYYKIDAYDSACACAVKQYAEVITQYNARGTGKKVPKLVITPNLFIDMFRGNGIQMLGVYAPGLGEEKNKWGGVFGAAARINPYRLVNGR